MRVDRVVVAVAVVVVVVSIVVVAVGVSTIVIVSVAQTPLLPHTIAPSQSFSVTHGSPKQWPTHSQSAGVWTGGIVTNVEYIVGYIVTVVVTVIGTHCDNVLDAREMIAYA